MCTSCAFIEDAGFDGTSGGGDGGLNRACRCVGGGPGGGDGTSRLGQLLATCLDRCFCVCLFLSPLLELPSFEEDVSSII